MAGHNKWSKIKRKKGVNDAKRSKIFSKLIKEIHIATRLHGPDPESNSRLRMAIENAKGENMPKDNVERAIKKASGDDSTDYQEITYEGYGPNGVAVVIECTTDNINRTVSTIKAAFNKFGGSMEKKGALEFIFEPKGIFVIPFPEDRDKDELFLEIIDAGAEDVEEDDGEITVTTLREDFGKVQQALRDMELTPKYSGLRQVPKIQKPLTPEQAKQTMKFIEVLEDDDDIQNVYHNIQPDDEVLEQLEQS